jgi:TetR/AcrR family transcriptional regulator, transcriptional repressor for nem operon
MPRQLEFDRDAALDAAAQVFWRQGFEATSIDDLTEALGIGRASLYHSFTDKRTLLTHVVDRYQQVARDHLATCGARPGTGRAVIEAMLQGIAKVKPGEPQGCMCINLGLELGEMDTALRTQVVAGLDRITDTFLMLLKRGQLDGSISQKVDAKTVAEALMGGVVSINALKRLEVPGSSLQSVLASQMRLLDG